MESNAGNCRADGLSVDKSFEIEFKVPLAQALGDRKRGVCGNVHLHAGVRHFPESAVAKLASGGSLLHKSLSPFYLDPGPNAWLSAICTLKSALIGKVKYNIKCLFCAC